MLNKVSILHIDLGSHSIETEESQLRAKITRPVMEDNDQIMANPYPKHYELDRQIWFNVWVKDSEISYAVTFCHSVLLYKHCRVYDLSRDDYSILLERLINKYGSPSIAVFEPFNHKDSFNMMHSFDLEKLSTVGE